ncbi:glycosyltransferase family 57 protein [Babjeviella inositovora NRRL Y-12698]|uniref:Dolichyl pyrophosphate Glc1Man9GlcNAc2 alpha-1,3-glucosyltransferase n=1 Tax=Babjeviella inositovora NRRL Y-12698 TaxID=984486 RepID=A0A1E3QTV4_9ASCO|nr:glycosyltransferase family 57 protein [Babjeviella inositovora NRRL Y-12698]ODQ81113.1 glycosyltransferase family 57 protein [Babjeviella inositovora NRRL Y-12698]
MEASDARLSFISTLDHFPCDLVRSLWLLQLLNMRVETLSTDLNTCLCTLQADPRNSEQIAIHQIVQIRTAIHMLKQEAVHEARRFQRLLTNHKAALQHDVSEFNLQAEMHNRLANEEWKREERKRLVQYYKENPRNRSTEPLVVKLRTPLVIAESENVVITKRTRAQLLPHKLDRVVTLVDNPVENGKLAIRLRLKEASSNGLKSKPGRKAKEKKVEITAPVPVTKKTKKAAVFEIEPELYCTCRDVFYGEMVACDDPKCEIEWYHNGCVGLTTPPRGKWYCPTCLERRQKTKPQKAEKPRKVKEPEQKEVTVKRGKGRPRKYPLPVTPGPGKNNNGKRVMTNKANPRVVINKPQIDITAKIIQNTPVNHAEGRGSRIQKRKQVTKKEQPLEFEPTSEKPETGRPSNLRECKRVNVLALGPDAPKAVRVATNRSLYNHFIGSLAIKILLFSAYHSTDFDVHRNWLSITHNLPLREWYLEETSQWTLDYPPFFAYFEWFVSQFVTQTVADDGCLDIVAKGTYGWPTIVFQRTSVILSEIVLYCALQWFINTAPNRRNAKQQLFVVASSLVLSPGLMIVDHIHFQYNGMMFGLLIAAITAARLERYVLCGAFFAVLLCFKHIFLYLAPAFFVFLLRAYCLDIHYPTGVASFVNLVRWRNLCKLGATVLGIFTLAFAPFVYYGVIPQLLARLFPFSRGLTHAYWAPNIWALYSFADRVLVQMCLHVPGVARTISSYFHHDVLAALTPEALAQNTRGLVRDVEFLVLPQITPRVTFYLTVFYQVMCLLPVLFQPSFNRFMGSMTLCAFASFLFGWHVHEKAIMLVVIPFSFLVIQDKRLLSSFNLLVSSGFVSLFPLIYTSGEWLLKCLYTFVWLVIYTLSYEEVAKLLSSITRRVFFMDRMVKCYILGLVPLVAGLGLMDILSVRVTALQRFEFLRLMVMSIYCAVGVVCSWNGVSWLYFVDEPLWVEENPGKL